MLKFASRPFLKIAPSFASFGLIVSLLSVAACSDKDPEYYHVDGDGSDGGNGNVGNSGGGAPDGAGGESSDGVGGNGGVSSGGGSQGGSGGSQEVSTGGFQAAGGAEPATGGVGEPAACEGELPNEGGSGEHTVTVDIQSSLGDLPHFWNTFGTGHMGLYLREDRGWGELLMEHTRDGVKNLGLTSLRQHGLFHDDLGIYREVDGVPVYDFSKSDIIFDFMVNLGIEPIVELAPMPHDLAADPNATVFDWGMIISPPKDYDRWRELVQTFVAHSIERYGLDIVSKWYFEVWNEPECCNRKFFAGSLQEYHQLYDYAAAGVRAAYPEGRVGGPVTSQPQELVGNSGSGVAFLDHVTTDNYVTPGSPGVLDFFSYHSWSFVGGAVDGYFQGVDLLNSYGLDHIPIAITEFGPTYQFGLEDEPQEMDQGAAFVVQTFSDISQRAAREGIRFPITYSWWVLSDVFEEEPEEYRQNDPFIGCMGLTSRENIHKPAYNAYKFLAQMGHEQVDLSVEGPGHVGGMAAQDAGGGVQVIIYNGQNPGPGPSGMGDTEDKYYNIAAAQDIAVSLSGLDPTVAYDVTAYRVDEVRGNAYAIWDDPLRMNRKPMSEMSDEDWQTLRDAMDSPPEPVGEALCGGTFSQTFSLSSPGVLFINFVPALR